MVDAELNREATVKYFLTVQNEGTRKISRELEHYNLDIIISVGYRIKSSIATAFRQWATAHLREYIIKGFTRDYFDYFDYFFRLAWARRNENKFFLATYDNLPVGYFFCLIWVL